MGKARHPRVPTVAIVTGEADYGPGLHRAKSGRLTNWGGAAQVEVEYRDDPSVTDHRRPVRGSRRRHALFELLQHRVISKTMFDAAQQFLDDCSIASGGSSADIGGMPYVSGPRTGLPERQVNAITRINEVRHLLGLNDGTIFWWVVFNNGALDAYEARHRLRKGTAADLLRKGLDALEQHYRRGDLRESA
jgi:hypothetical protein